MNAPLLEQGLYTVGDAARLLRVNPRKIRGWVSGYAQTKAAPIISNDIGWLEGALAFSFTNLMEMRFIQHFAALNVRVASIRAMAEEAVRILKHPHPFATETVFHTDGRKIFADIADVTGDRRLYDLRAKNWAMLEVIQQSLHEGVSYNPSGEAISWRPRTEFRDVIIHPTVAFGQPTIRDTGIPTRTLYEAFQAEEEDFDTVAKWYDLPAACVREAVRFELQLAMAA